MSQVIERRHGHGSVRAKGDRKLGGLGIPFDVLSEDLGGFRERIAPGAFTDSIEQDDIRSLFNHDSSFVLGRKSAGTLRLSEDERGISYEVDVPDTQWAKDLTESIRRGDIRENSFAFFVNGDAGDTWVQTETGLERTVTHATLKELGPQPFPAYTQSTVDVRSIEAVLERGRKCVGKACPGGGQDPDVLLRELELDLDRRGLKGSSGRDLAELERELDLRTKSSGYLSRTEIEALAGDEYLNLLAVCYHEAAHAVVGILAGNTLTEVGLRCEKHEGSLARIVGHCTMRSAAMTPQQWMAGQAAEDLHGFPPHITGTGSNEDRARAAAMEERGIETGLSQAKKLLRQHWQAVKWLAIELQHDQVVSGTEATRMIIEQLDWDTQHRLRNAA